MINIAKQRWSGLKHRSEKYGFNCCSFEEFYIFWLQERKCHYCGIDEKLIKKIYPTLRIKSLTIDRIDNKWGYEASNICLACFPCNTIKGYLLTATQMHEIAEKYVRPRWVNGEILRTKKRKVEKKVSEKTCLQCGSTFEIKNNHGKYCSEECKQYGT